MNPQPRRRIVPRLVGFLLAAAAVAVGALYLWVRATESRRWAGMEARLVELEKEAVQPPGPRPVLHGEAVPGNAWEEYDRGMKAVQEQGRLTQMMNYGSSALVTFSAADRELIRQRLRESGPALDALIQGARRERERRTVDWRAESRVPSPAFYLSQVAIAQARDWIEEGRLHDAVGLLLDVARFATDLGSNADMIGGLISMAMLSYALDRLQEILVRGGLTREDQLLLDEALGRLDRSFPDLGRILVNEAMASGWDFHRADSLAGYMSPLYAGLGKEKPRIPTWRHAFSERLVMVSAFEDGLAAARRLAAAQAGPWREASAAAVDVDREVADSSNALRRATFALVGWDQPNFRNCATFRHRRAQIRLIRAAAHYRATGEILPLDDPFAGKLSHSLQEGRLKLWSVGRDGIDHGGDGNWSVFGKDLVLEVPK